MSCRRWLAVYVLALILAGCKTATPTPTLTPAATATYTPTLVSATATPVATATSIPQPTATATPTNQPTSQPTNTPLSLPTPFPSFAHPISQSAAPISPGDVGRVTELGRWGRGILKRAAFSPDGRWLAVATSVGVVVYDAGTLEEINFFETQTAVERLAFSPDGAHLIAGGGNVLQLWQVPDGTSLFTTTGQDLGDQARELHALAFSPAGDVVVAAWYPNVVHLRRASDGALLGAFRVPEGVVGPLYFAPDHLLVVSSHDKSLWVWQISQCLPAIVADGSGETLPEACITRLHRLRGETNWTRVKAFSPDGTLLAAKASNNPVWLWQVEDGKRLPKVPMGGANITFSPDNALLALGSSSGPESGVVRLLRVEDCINLPEGCEEPFHTLQGHRGAVRDVAFSPDGETLASVSADGTLRLWHTGDWSLLHVLGGYTRREVSSLALSPDDALLAVGSGDGDVGLWQLTGAMLQHTLQGHGGGVSDVAFAPDGETVLVSGVRDKRLRLWRVEDGELLHLLREHQGNIAGVAFSPDGSALVAGDGSGSVYLWRAEDGEPLHKLTGYGAEVKSVAVSPDGTIVAAGHRLGVIQLWDGERGELLKEMDMGDSDVTDVAFSPEGQILAAVDANKIWLWQRADWTPLRILTGHTGDVQCLAFSSDGALLASGTDDDKIWLWQVSTGTLLRTLRGHTGAVTSLVFASDGAFLASGSADGTVRFWGASSTAAVAEAPPTPTAPPTLIGGPPAGEVNHLWVAPDGRLWLATETGIYIHAGDEWTQIYEGLANRVLGLDDAGRVWASVDGGWHIAALTDTAWTLYGPDQGWSQSHGEQPVTDRQGRVWLTTGRDLRRFDPQTQTWTIFSPTDVGFKPLEEPSEQEFVVTDVALDGAGNVWVGSCAHWGITIQGQGVRWFDGERWDSSPDTAGECVNDIEVDEAGRVWMGGFYGLLQYDPAAQAWSEFPLPGWDRPQLINSITLDEAGNPWVTFTRFGGAGPWHSSALFHLQDGTWVADYDPGYDIFFRWDFDPDGAAWVCAEGDVYHLTGGQQEAVDHVGFCRQIVVDGAGQVWIRGDADLWWIEPPAR